MNCLTSSISRNLATVNASSIFLGQENHDGSSCLHTGYLNDTGVTIPETVKATRSVKMWRKLNIF